MAEFNRDDFQHAVSHMAPWKRLAFIASTCERMLPNYARFSAETGFGDISVLREAVDVIWKCAAKESSAMDFSKLIIACERQTPDTEHFVSPFTSAALDAAVASTLGLEAILSGGVEEGLDVAALSRDTVDLFIQNENLIGPDAADLETEILRHPLMQRELARQHQDVAALAALPDGQRQTVRVALNAGPTQGSLA